MTKPDFTICVLLYGDYPHLADRCLRSITQAVPVQELKLRIGLNAVSARVSNWVKSWADPSWIYESAENINKYPLMRRMFYSSPLETPYTMWFDDDSYVTAGPPTPDKSFLATVRNAMQDADMLGSKYTMGWSGNQKEFVRAQPWYQGKPLPSKMGFITGGWWTIRTPLLYKFNYPWQDLDHNGGDSMLGVCCDQNDIRTKQFRTGVAINADANGRESKAKRRGTSQKNYGWDFDPNTVDALHRATS